MSKYIDAEKLKAEGWHLVRERSNRWQAYIEGMDLDLVPTADVAEVKRGRWLWDDEGYHCSECLYHAYGETGEVLSGHWHYCPNCGAKMDEGGDTE